MATQKECLFLLVLPVGRVPGYATNIDLSSGWYCSTQKAAIRRGRLWTVVVAPVVCVLFRLLVPITRQPVQMDRCLLGVCLITQQTSTCLAVGITVRKRSGEAFIGFFQFVKWNGGKLTVKMWKFFTAWLKQVEKGLKKAIFRPSDPEKVAKIGPFWPRYPKKVAALSEQNFLYRWNFSQKFYFRTFDPKSPKKVILHRTFAKKSPKNKFAPLCRQAPGFRIVAKNLWKKVRKSVQNDPKMFRFKVFKVRSPPTHTTLHFWTHILFLNCVSAGYMEFCFRYLMQFKTF